MKLKLDGKVPAVTECFVSPGNGPGPLDSHLVTEHAPGGVGVGDTASREDFLEYFDELAAGDH